MNPYTDFVKSLTDAQLDALYDQMQATAYDYGDIDDAVDIEWETRERATHLTVYTPDLDEFRRLFTAEGGDSIRFVTMTRARMNELRLLPGWSFELEVAFRQIIFQLLEQLPGKD